MDNKQGRGIFAYDKPSSLFGHYGNERARDVGRDLDATPEAALLDAAAYEVFK